LAKKIIGHSEYLQNALCVWTNISTERILDSVDSLGEKPVAGGEGVLTSVVLTFVFLEFVMLLLN